MRESVAVLVLHQVGHSSRRGIAGRSLFSLVSDRAAFSYKTYARFLTFPQGLTDVSSDTNTYTTNTTLARDQTYIGYSCHDYKSIVPLL